MMNALRYLFVLAVLAVSAAAQPAPPEPPPIVREALAKFQAGDLTGAIALLAPLREDQSAPPAALSLLGTLYLQADQVQEALEVLAPLADSDKAGPIVLDVAGRAARASGDEAKAQAYWERAAAKAPVSPAARELGFLYGRQGRVVDSYRLLRPWAAEHPEDTEAVLSAAFCGLELGRLPEVEKLLATVADIAADEPRARMLRGRLSLALGEPQAAIESLSPLLTDAAFERDARLYLGEAHLALGQASEAVTALAGKVEGDARAALVLARAQYQDGNPAAAAATLEPLLAAWSARELSDPEEKALAGDVALELGRALIGLARWQDAAAALSRATQLDPDEAQAWQLLAQSQLAAGLREEGQKALERFRTLQSGQKTRLAVEQEAARARKDPTAAALERARELAAKGQSDEALAVVQRELAVASPDDPRPRIVLVALLLQLGRKEEALAAAEAGVQAVPGSADFLHLKGAAEMALSRLADAERDLRQALTVKPDHPGALNDLAVLLLSQGRKEEADALRKR